MNCFRNNKISQRFLIRILRSNYSTAALNEELPASFVDEDTEAVNPKKFDKSGLRPQHRNVLHEIPPYNEVHSWIHLTEKYQRKVYGRYGSKSNISPQICFDAATKVAEVSKLQRITQPQTLHQILEKVRVQKAEKQNAIRAREEDISKKFDKLEQWKSDLYAKVAKREADALAAKERKERLIEEVRRHFGFKVDPRDERFKELLEQKEKEDKRKQKEAKRKVKEEKMMAKLVEKSVAA